MVRRDTEIDHNKSIYNTGTAPKIIKNFSSSRKKRIQKNNNATDSLPKAWGTKRKRKKG